jgi:undecaprenyl-phosphate 4-deoxy-4-formamido-L-arabinose transferase
VGHDLVGTFREDRQDTLFRKAASWMVNRMIRKFSKIELRDFGCMLRGYSGEVARSIAVHKEYKTFIPALGTLHASNPVEIPVSHAKRAAGQSKYSFFRLVSLALDLVTCFSLTPLRLLFVCGTLVCTLGVGFGLFLLAMRWFLGEAWAAQGVFTLFAILFIFIGAQFVAFGLLGEYVGRIFRAGRAGGTDPGRVRRVGESNGHLDR